MVRLNVALAFLILAGCSDNSPKQETEKVRRENEEVKIQAAKSTPVPDGKKTITLVDLNSYYIGRELGELESDVGQKAIPYFASDQNSGLWVISQIKKNDIIFPNGEVAEGLLVALGNGRITTITAPPADAVQKINGRIE